MSETRQDLKEMRTLQQQRRAIDKQIDRAKARLEANFGSTFAEILETEDFPRLIQVMRMSADNAELLKNLAEDFGEELACAAIGSKDREKACFALVVLQRREALQVAREIGRKSTNFIANIVTDRVNALAASFSGNPREMLEFMDYFHANPEMPNEFFCGLDYGDLEVFAKRSRELNGAHEEVLCRARGEGLKEHERKENYYSLVADHVPVEQAVGFFQPIMESGDETPLADPDIRSSIVFLALRSKKARKEWLPRIGIASVSEEPEFLTDAFARETGMEKITYAKKLAEMKIKIKREKAVDIFESTDFTDPYSWAAFLLVLPLMEIRRVPNTSQTIHIAGQGMRKFARNFAQDFFHLNKTHPAIREVAHLPWIEREYQALVVAFPSALPETQREIFETLYLAGGQCRLAAAALSQSWYEKEGGDYRELPSECSQIAETSEKRSFVDRTVTTLLDHRDTRRNALMFLFASGMAEKFEGEIREIERDADNANYAKIASVTAKGGLVALSNARSFSSDGGRRKIRRHEDIEDVATKVHAVKMTRPDAALETMYLAHPRRACAVFAFAFGGCALGFGSVEETASIYDSLSESEKEWVREKIRTHILSQFENPERHFSFPDFKSTAQFIIRAGIAHHFRDEMAEISAKFWHGVQHHITSLAKAVLAQLDDHLIDRELDHLSSTFVRVSENDPHSSALVINPLHPGLNFHEAMGMLEAAGGRYSVLHYAFSLPLERSRGNKGAGSFHELDETDRKWVVYRMKKEMANPLSPACNHSLTFMMNEGIANLFEEELVILAGQEGDVGIYARGMRMGINEENEDKIAGRAIAMANAFTKEEFVALQSAGGKYRILAAAIYKTNFEVLGGDYGRAIENYSALNDGDRAWVDGKIREALHCVNPVSQWDAIIFIANAGIERFEEDLREDLGFMDDFTAGALSALPFEDGVLEGFYETMQLKRFASFHAMAFRKAGGKYEALLAATFPRKVQAGPEETFRDVGLHDVGGDYESAVAACRELSEEDKQWLVDFINNLSFDPKPQIMMGIAQFLHDTGLSPRALAKLEGFQLIMESPFVGRMSRIVMEAKHFDPKGLDYDLLFTKE